MPLKIKKPLYLYQVLTQRILQKTSGKTRSNLLQKLQLCVLSQGGVKGDMPRKAQEPKI